MTAVILQNGRSRWASGVGLIQQCYASTMHSTYHAGCTPAVLMVTPCYTRQMTLPANLAATEPVP